MDKYVCVTESQADTYIEECFEQKCLALRDIINQWRTDKDCFTTHTSITNIDFQHYSLHDKSHSIAILRNIEMVLGKERVKALSASDLWLLLETAYCHDIGMSITYDELCEIWKSNEFQEFIKSALDSEFPDRKKFAQFYEKINNLIHDKTMLENAANKYEMEDADSKFDTEFDDILSQKSWPVVCERYIMLLYTEYIRKKHPEYSKMYMLLYSETERNIPQRMYGIVASVVKLHGEDFEKVFELATREENGFGAELMHPQFAAVMLRLGDLLDMDSNRFNVRMMKHLGIMPIESMLHLKKHKAMTHLSYSENVIQAEARSDDFEVCKTAQQWFDWLDDEVKNLICNWNRIAPSVLAGCRMNRCELKVFYKGQKFDSGKQTKFMADPERVYQMLIGDNIYKSRLDFIREYLQNALDASKMSLWLSIKADEAIWEQYTPKNITPYDIPEKWFERYKIEIEAHIDWNRQELILSFQDHGVGMEQECLKVLSNIAGDSWQKRKTYAKEIAYMPSWLKPTAGFGIGVQSAFMITDNVEFRTRTENELTGRKICMEGIRKGGRLSEYEDAKAEIGTKVLVRIGLYRFLKEVMRNQSAYLQGVSGNIYDRRELPKMVLHILKNYVANTAEYSLFPITITCDDEKMYVFEEKWRRSTDGEDIKLGEEKKLPDGTEKEWTVRYVSTKNLVFLWIADKQLMVIYKNDFLTSKRKDSCYYKGILISGESMESSGGCSMQILYFEENVRGLLTLNRDNFRQNCSDKFEKDLRLYKYLLARLISSHVKDFKECSIFNAMAVGTLTYYGLGKTRIDDIAIETFLDSVSSKIEIMQMNFEELKSLNNQKRQEECEYDDIVYETILEKKLLKRTKIDIKEFVRILKDDDYFLCETEKDFSSVRISLSLLVKEMLNSDGKKVSPDDPEYIYALLRKGTYIITEKEVCRILNEQGIEKNYINIKQDDQYMMRIAYMEKAKMGREADSLIYGDRIKEFVRNTLDRIIKINTERIFPLALCVSVISREEAAYQLWVSEVYPGTTVFSLDTNDIVGENVRSKRNLNIKYLILPINQWTWANVIREKSCNNDLQKKKYDEIIRDADELKFLEEWSYHYQDNDGIKLKRSEIREQYYKIFDLLYLEYFKSFLC